MKELNPEIVLADLRQKSQTCKDNAQSELIVADAFRDEYNRGLSGHPDASAATHARSMQLYDFVIGSQHRRINFLADAQILDYAIRLIESATQASGTKPDSWQPMDGE